MGWVTAASALLAFLLYYNTLDNEFVYDDKLAILSNPDVIGHTSIGALFTNDFWGTPLNDTGSHGSYRPLCVITYRLNYFFSGFNPWSYHFVNVMLHCSATILVVIVARRLLPAYCIKVGTAVTGLAFAAHPVHTEAVAGVVGRADLAACNFFLLSFLVYCKHMRMRDEREQRILRNMGYQQTETKSQTEKFIQFLLQFPSKLIRLLKNKKPKNHKISMALKKGPAKVNNMKAVESVSVCEYKGEVTVWLTLMGSFLLTIAGTLCKEPAIMALPLCICYDFMKGLRQEPLLAKIRWRSIYAVTVAGFILLYCRFKIAGTPTDFVVADNPASRDPSTFTRFYTFAYLPIFNFFLLLYPFQLSFDWSMDSIPKITSFGDSRMAITIVFYGLLVRVIWKAGGKLLKKHHIEKQKPTPKPQKEIKYHNKKRSHKGKRKRNHKQSRQHSELQKSTIKDNASKKQMCPCPGCNYPLTDDHTNTCRTVNNNNLLHYSTCICPTSHAKCQVLNSQRYFQHTPQATLMFTAFMVLPFLPASNIFFYVGFVVAERVLYIPSVGFCLLLGLGAGSLTRKWHDNETKTSLFMLASVLALCAMSSTTVLRNQDWRNEENLYRSAVDINPAKAYGNLGSVLSSQGRSEEAEFAFKQALKYRPNMAEVHYNLGILYQKEKKYEEAIRCFKKAIMLRPSLALAYANLGNSLTELGRLDEAEMVLNIGGHVDGAVRDRREHTTAQVSSLVQLGSLHLQKEHLKEALAVYREALQMIPPNQSPDAGWTRQNVIDMIGRVLALLNNCKQVETEQTLIIAIYQSPKNAVMHFTLANFIAKNASRAEEAEKWYKKAIELAPDNPTPHDQYASFLWSKNRILEATKHYIAAATLDPTDSTRAAAAARALRDARLYQSSEEWYARAVQLKPDNADHYINLGAIYHVNGKLRDAELAYKRSLELVPDDEVAKTNLKRVRTMLVITKQNRSY